MYFATKNRYRRFYILMRIEVAYWIPAFNRCASQNGDCWQLDAEKDVRDPLVFPHGLLLLRCSLSRIGSPVRFGSKSSDD